MSAAPPAAVREKPVLDGRLDAIVIGTSAGGIEALSQLLPALPAGLAAAVLVVIHLPRDRPSLLTEIFAARCALKVEEAEDKRPIEPGVIYFAPPDYHLLVDNGGERGPVLALSSDEPVQFSRPSIDVLFESAADVYGERLLGMVLTGANHDGADGLAAVRAAGGVAVVQRPESAQSSLMPAAALQRVPDAEFVLTLTELAAFLAGLQ
ncbi:MAG TPA: chemotaxis protein CheB [Burkholderiales bacterium]|jgi:two-component system chemotaxis response regulator CheB